MKQINFIWPVGFPLIPGAGGSETFVLGMSEKLSDNNYSTKIYQDISNANAPSLLKDLSTKNNTIEIFINEFPPAYFKKQCIVSLHCPPDKQFDYDKNFLPERHVLITNSKFSRAAYSSLIKANKPILKIVYPWVSPVFTSVSKIRGSTNKVLYAGRIDKKKGTEIFLGVARLSARQNDGLQFGVIASPYLDDYGREYISICKAEPNINVLDSVSNPKQMAELISQWDILVMPSLWPEPFGRLSIEAQHLGVRVIAADIGGISETDCGLLEQAKHGDIKDFYNKIISTSTLGAPSIVTIKKAQEYFTLQVSFDAFVKVVKSIE